MKRPSSCLNFPTRANDWTIMQKNIELTKELLNEIFEYSDGNLIHKHRDKKHFSRINSFVYFNRYFATRIAKTYIRKDGYIGIAVLGKLMLYHRVVFMFFNGQIPIGIEIDHIDRDKNNNNIQNLRMSRKGENQRNRKINANSKTGVKCVCFRKDSMKYRAIIKKDGKVFQHQFDTLEDAEIWVRANRIELHGEFANHGST